MEDPYIGKRNDKDNKGGAKIRQKKKFYDIEMIRQNTMIIKYFIPINRLE